MFILASEVISSILHAELGGIKGAQSGGAGNAAIKNLLQPVPVLEAQLPQLVPVGLHSRHCLRPESRAN
jgi:hypothetical protein